MAKKTKIDYELLVQNAVRKEIAELLRDVSQNGLPGDHYFYIVFLTTFPGVVISDNLRDEYPEDMMISIQYEFFDLTVLHDSFSVTLVFDDEEVRITVPFNSIIQFSDPSVDFGYEFEPTFDRFDDEKIQDLLSEFDDESGLKQHSSDVLENNVISFDFSKTRH